MPLTTLNGSLVPIRMWSPAHEVDSKAIAQLRAVASLPWVAHHVAVMPDVHTGVGATVGSVIAMRAAVAPAAVGVDIGCGMTAQKTSIVARDLPDVSAVAIHREDLRPSRARGREDNVPPIW